MATVKGALTAGGPEIKRAHAKLKGKDKNGKVEHWWYYSLEVDTWDVVAHDVGGGEGTEGNNGATAAGTRGGPGCHSS